MVKTRKRASETQQSAQNTNSGNGGSGEFETQSEQRLMNMMQKMLTQQLEEQRLYFEMKIAEQKDASGEGSDENSKSQKSSKQDDESIRRDPGRKRKRRCEFKTFFACQPPKYEGSPNPVITNKWISEIEQTFQACECEDYQRVMFAVKMLKGRALTWWNTVSKAMDPTELEDMPWEEFIHKLKGKYCADRDVQKLEGEFLNLKKGNMSIDEYAATFVDKMEFAMNLVPDEQSRVNRFVAGLPSDYQLPVKEKATLDQAISKAKDVEDMLAMRGLERKSFGDKRNFGGKPDSHKKGRFMGGEKKSSTSDDAKWCDKCKKKHKGKCGDVHCYKCCTSG